MSRGKCFFTVGLVRELLLCSNFALASFIDLCLRSLRDMEAELKQMVGLSYKKTKPYVQKGEIIQK